MEFQDVVRRRKMVRDYATDPVDPAIIERATRNAVRAPNAGFSQGWGFLVLDQPDDVRRYWEVTCDPDELAEPDAWLTGMMHAPVIVVPCSSKAAYLKRYAQADKGWTDEDEARWPVPFWHIDTGMAALLILQTVTDEGLGACYFGVPPERVAPVRAAFGIPTPSTRSAPSPSATAPPPTASPARRASAPARPRRTSSTTDAGAPDTRRAQRRAQRRAPGQSIGRTPPGQRAPRGGGLGCETSGCDSTPAVSNVQARADEGAPMIHRSPLPDVEIPDQPLVDYVLARADELGDKPALIDGPSGRTLTYAALKHAVRALAGGLVARGFAPGDTLAILAPNLPEYAIVFHGVAYAGGVVTTINPTYIEREVHHQLVDADARLLVTVAPFLDMAKAAAEGTNVEEIFVIGEAAGGALLHRADGRAAGRAGARRSGLHGRAPLLLRHHGPTRASC